MATIPKTGTLYFSTVRNTLGENTTDLGKLCTSPNINPWTKYKPVRLSNPFPPINSTWWKAVDGNCGFTIPQMTNPNQSASLNWKYNPPAGGESSPFRLDDFRGYNTVAIPVMSHNYGNTLNINKATLINNQYHLFFSMPSSGTDQLAVEDFDQTEVGECYLTVQIVYPNSTITYQSGTGKVKDRVVEIVLDLTYLNPGTYTLRFFLSTERESGSAYMGMLYPIPQSASSPAELKMVITSASTYRFIVSAISWNINGTFEDIARLTPGASNRKRLQTFGSVCFQITARNQTGSAGSLNISSLRVMCDSFFGTTETVGVTAVYNANKTQLTGTVPIPVGDTTFYIYVNNLLALRNGQSVIPTGDAPSTADGLFRVVSGTTVNIGDFIFLAVYGFYEIVDDTW